MRSAGENSSHLFLFCYLRYFVCMAPSNRSEKIKVAVEGIGSIKALDLVFKAPRDEKRQHLEPGSVGETSCFFLFETPT